MLARTGNMAEVYRAFWDMQEVTKRAEAWINEPQRAMAGMEAEIAEGSTADWYLVQTFPGDDVKAMRYLARRRFGVFRPMWQRTDKHNDAVRLQGLEPVFPGWLFVYVWGMATVQHRIRSCPGVWGILCYPVSLKPAPIPDKFINGLRELSVDYNEQAAYRSHASVEAERHTRRRQPKIDKKHRKALKKLRKAFRRSDHWDASTWAKAKDLEPHQRIALLRQALMLPDAGCLWNCE